MNRKVFLRKGIRMLGVITVGGIFLPELLATPARKGKTLLRFGLFSDGHYGQKNTDFDGFHQQMVGWLNTEHKERGLDFVIFNGDLFHDDSAVIPGLKTQLAKLTMPMYPNHGNHDMIEEAGWEKAFGYPYNYVVEKKEAAFIFLNTADEKGTYINEPVGWMQTQLERLGTQKPLYIIMHITPFKWTGAGLPHPEMVKIFAAQPNIKAIFHGHDHDEDGWKTDQGKTYFFDGHTGGSWGLDYKGYRVVELDEEGNTWLYQYNPAAAKTVNEYRL
jgi:hypothetical protein